MLEMVSTSRRNLQIRVFAHGWNFMVYHCALIHLDQPHIRDGFHEGQCLPPHHLHLQLQQSSGLSGEKKLHLKPRWKIRKQILTFLQILIGYVVEMVITWKAQGGRVLEIVLLHFSTPCLNSWLSGAKAWSRMCWFYINSVSFFRG